MVAEPVVAEEAPTATPAEEPPSEDEPWPEAPSWEQSNDPPPANAAAANAAATGALNPAPSPSQQPPTEASGSPTSDAIERVRRIFPGRIVGFTAARVDAAASEDVALEGPADLDLDPELGGSA